MKLAAEQVLRNKQLQAWLEHLALQAHSGQKWLIWKASLSAVQRQAFLLKSWEVFAKALQQVQVLSFHWTQPQAGLPKPEALSLPEVPACPAAVFFVSKPFQSQSQSLSLLFLHVQEKKLQQKVQLELLWQQTCQQQEQVLLQHFAVWEKEAFDFPQIQN